jgi:tetratricopeptide (TPR) repeat protein
MILSALTGSPVGAIVILFVFWYGLDRFTFQLLPNPLRWINRWRRQSQLRNTIAINPNDRRARLELSDLLVGQRRFAPAVELLKPNVEAGDDDATTLFVLGVACLGSGRTEQGEIFLEAARDADPTYRLGSIDLELGRWRLARGDAAGALEPLQRFCDTRRGTVEGKVLLARAVAAKGDAPGAARLRDAAWDEYVSSPVFQRRQERFWAWRARPSRPLTYGVVLLLLGLAFNFWVAPELTRSLGHRGSHARTHDPEE